MFRTERERKSKLARQKLSSGGLLHELSLARRCFMIQLCKWGFCRKDVPYNNFGTVSIQLTSITENHCLVLPVPPSLATIITDVDDLFSTTSKIGQLEKLWVVFLNSGTHTVFLSSANTHLSLSLGGSRGGHCLTVIYQKKIYRVHQTLFLKIPILDWIFNPEPLGSNGIWREDKVHFLSVCFSTKSYCCGNRKCFYYTLVPEEIHSQGTLP